VRIVHPPTKEPALIGRRDTGLTPREAEVLLWVAQGKANSEIATILGCAENTVKVHLARIFEKLGFENRNAATVRALEVLSVPVVRDQTGSPRV